MLVRAWYSRVLKVRSRQRAERKERTPYWKAGLATKAGRCISGLGCQVGRESWSMVVVCWG